MAAAREQWSSKTGFVLAAVGSAVGLGNMWRFSYVAAEQGGAAFVLLYLVFTALVGLPVLVAEMMLGRGSRKSPIEALGHYGGAAWKPLGFVFVAAGFLIIGYYGVIAGWTVRYAGEMLLFGPPPDAGAHFGEISQGWPAFGFHVLFMVATLAIVMGGVKKGIERVAMVAMPVLFGLVVGIALYAATLEGSAGGYAYYLDFELRKALHVDVIVAAAGQAFFSLSLGMGAMLTFASYLPRDSHLPYEGAVIALSDFGVAFVAGLMVFPLIFALGLAGSVTGTFGTENEVGTVGALFVAMPEAFAHMGGGGRLVGFAFFLALVVGALTSAISLLEVVVSATIDGLGWSRHQAVVVMGALTTAVGAFSAFDLAVLDVMDQVATNLFLLLGGFLLAVFVGWVMVDPIGEARPGAMGFRGFGPWRLLLRFAVPVILGGVLWQAVPRTLLAVQSLF